MIVHGSQLFSNPVTFSYHKIFRVYVICFFLRCLANLQLHIQLYCAYVFCRVYSATTHKEFCSCEDNLQFLVQYPCKYNTTYGYICMYTHIFVTIMLLQLIVHDDCTILIPNWLSGASLQLLAVYLLSTLFGILIPAVSKVTESIVQLSIMHLLA